MRSKKLQTDDNLLSGSLLNEICAVMKTNGNICRDISCVTLFCIYLTVGCGFMTADECSRLHECENVKTKMWLSVHINLLQIILAPHRSTVQFSNKPH